jgi:hypothetical protein
MSVRRAGARFRVGFSVAAPAVVVAVSFSGCGATMNANTAAEVNGAPISRTEVAHWSRVIANGGAVPTSGEGVASVRQRAVEFLIYARWLSGEARATVGNSVTAMALAVSDAGFRQSLELAGETEHDIDLTAKVEADIGRLSGAVIQKEKPINQLRVQAYYKEHEAELAVSEARTFGLAEGFETRKDVEAVMKAGKAKVYAAAIHETRSRSNFENLSGAKAREYKQLLERIFAAQPHRLVGPFRVYGHWAAFEVEHVSPGAKRSFASVRATIEHRLATQEHAEALADFVQAWQQRWRSLTDCASGFVVAECKEYRGGAVTVAQTPFGGR